MKRRRLDDGQLTKITLLLLPPLGLFAYCGFWLKAFPVWYYIAVALFLVAFFVAATVICVKNKDYHSLIKIYLYGLSSALTFYAMSLVPSPNPGKANANDTVSRTQSEIKTNPK